MKFMKTLFLTIILCAAAFAQTQDLGMGAFANENGPIMLAVDAAFATRQLDNPYVFLVLYMAARNPNENIAVSRDDVVMVYNGREYKMTPIREIRDKYLGQFRDTDFNRHLGKEGIIASWIRFYQFPQKADYFPLMTMDAPVVADVGSMYGVIGFETKCYFNNPGFKKGDKFVLKVKDKTNPSLTGEVEVVLK